MDRYLHYQRENPSFSSSLLDAIYRSIDESNGKQDEELIFYRQTMRKKHNNSEPTKEDKKASVKNACMIEKWMEDKVSYEKKVKKSVVANSLDKTRPVLLNSSSSSSESSCGGVFSSSESESTNNYTMQRPKPIRTSAVCVDEVGVYTHYTEASQKAYKNDVRFVKSTKSKALKIYGDLKKVKQPISPGGRLASFLNSLFTTGVAKKAKISSPASVNDEKRKLKSEQASACSSASSFSRSCLSKTPSSRGNGTKRSVRFYPVSVILDEDSRPCGHKRLEQENTALATINQTINEELKFHVLSESRRVEEVARDLLKNYQKKKQEELNIQEYSDDDDDDDVASYASSDLFELDNLSVIGIERYQQELPVYETTNLGTNRVIAHGLML